MVDAEELVDTFGILISFPENPNWIADSEYYLVDENNLRISYHDSIADADCTLIVSKNNNLNLPQAEIVNKGGSERQRSRNIKIMEDIRNEY